MPALWVKVLALGTFVMGLFKATDAVASSGGVEGDYTGEGPTGYAGVSYYARKLAQLLDLSKEDATTLELIFLAQAYSESRGKLSAANQTDSEREASRNLYFARGNDLKLEKAVGSFPDNEWFTPGSSGWFGTMPTTLVNVVAGRDARGLGITPKFPTKNPWLSAVNYLAYLQRLTRRNEWSASSKDLYALKAGGAAGSLMDNWESARYKKAQENLDKAVRALKLPSDTGTRKVSGDITRNRDWLAIYKAGM